MTYGVYDTDKKCWGLGSGLHTDLAIHAEPFATPRDAQEWMWRYEWDNDSMCHPTIRYEIRELPE
jgi:hypothetical protein